MRFIYVVQGDDGEETWTEIAFPTEQAAKEWVEQLNKAEPHGSQTVYEIERIAYVD